jgi:hypothetical protein
VCIRGFLDGNTLASIGVDPNCYIDSSTFIETHFGFSPYGIHRPAGAGSNRPILSWSVLDSCAFEAIGNGYIFSEAQEGGHADDRVFGNHIVGGLGGSWADGFKLPAVARKAGICCAGFTRNEVHMWGGQTLSPYTGVTTAFFSVGTFSENYFVGPDVLLGGARPMAIAPNGAQNWKLTRTGGLAQMVKDGSNRWS